MINLPEETVEKARNLGLNISKVCENALNDMITRLERSNPSKDNKDFSVNASSQEGVVRLPGFEPGLKAWKAFVLDQARPQSQWSLSF